MQKIFFLPTYLPYFWGDRYRKQTISFFKPNTYAPAIEIKEHFSK